MSTLEKMLSREPSTAGERRPKGKNGHEMQTNGSPQKEPQQCSAAGSCAPGAPSYPSMADANAHMCDDHVPSHKHAQGSQSSHSTGSETMETAELHKEMPPSTDASPGRELSLQAAVNPQHVVSHITHPAPTDPLHPARLGDATLQLGTLGQMDDEIVESPFLFPQSRLDPAGADTSMTQTATLWCRCEHGWV